MEYVVVSPETRLWLCSDVLMFKRNAKLSLWAFNDIFASVFNVPGLTIQFCAAMLKREKSSVKMLNSMCKVCLIFTVNFAAEQLELLHTKHPSPLIPMLI